jgi:hypothetical protein
VSGVSQSESRPIGNFSFVDDMLRGTEMPELRKKFFTKEWVIIATERAKRPEELAMHHPPKVVPPFVATCPFCPSNEAKTPPEVLRVPVDLVQPWTVRVVPNKFAALSPTLQPTRTIHRSRRSISGFGVHDVIIETPDHSQVTALLPHLDIANILRARLRSRILPGLCAWFWPSCTTGSTTRFQLHGAQRAG